MGLGQRLVLGERPSRTMARTLVWAVLAWGLFGYIFRPVWTDGQSMEPTIENRTLHAANLLAYRWGGKPRRGDVVVLRYRGRRVMYLKRVIGLPGETVAFRDGRLFLNGEPSEEAYLQQRGDWTIPPQELGPRMYFVAGDNRLVPVRDDGSSSAPSVALVGLVRQDDIEGKLWGSW